MKIIKQGDTAWWVGQRATCSICDAVIEFDQVDNVAPEESTVFGLSTGRWFVALPCPTPDCTATIRLYEDEARQQRAGDPLRAEMV